jgi:hypothetical protein
MQILVANKMECSTVSAGFAGVWAIHSSNKFAPLLQIGAVDALRLAYNELVIERRAIGGVSTLGDLDDSIYLPLNN